MRQLLKRLIRMTAGYGMIQWAGPLLSFIFTPIITRILTPGDYGIADYLLTINSALATLAAFAVPQSLTAHYNDRPDSEWKRTIAGSALVGVLPIAVVTGLGLIVFAPQIVQSAFNNQAYVPLLQLLGATFGIGVGGAVIATAAQADLRVRWGMAIGLTNILFTVSGNVLFIVVLRLGVTGMILTPVVTGTASALVAYLFGRSLIGRPTWKVIKQVLRSGAVLLPTMLAGWVLQVVDRLFLVHYVTTTELGHYAIANRIASLLAVILTPVYGAWTSLALAMQHESGAAQRYASMARYLVAVALIGSTVLGLFATEVLIVFTRTPYLPAAPYVGLLTYMHVFSAVSTTLTIGGFITKQLKSISGSVVAGAVVNVVLNMALIPVYGIWGATVATAISYAVPIVILFVRVRSLLPMPYPMRPIVLAMGAQLGLLGLGTLVPAIAFVPRVGLKLLILSILPLAFVMTGLITRFEVKHARLFVSHRLRLALARARS